MEGLILKFQYFGHLMQRADSWEKTLMLEKIEGWLDSVINSMDMSLSKLSETVKHRESWCAAIRGVEESGRTEKLKNKIAT